MDATPLVVLRDPPRPAAENMAADEALLATATEATLRFYGWSPSALSLGRFQDPALAPALPEGAERVARVTGGGAIFHHDELTFALVLLTDAHPWAANPLRLYAFCNKRWIRALASLGIDAHERTEAEDSGPFLCFDRKERTDLVVGDRKLLGSAQRRTADRVLIHGSLPLGPNPMARGAISVSEAAGQRHAADVVADAFVAALAAEGFTPREGA